MRPSRQTHFNHKLTQQEVKGSGKYSSKFICLHSLMTIKKQPRSIKIFLCQSHTGWVSTYHFCLNYSFKAHIHSTSASESVRAGLGKLCDGKCVKGQLLWYERGPELMQWVNTWRNRENNHRRGLFWPVCYQIYHAHTEFNQKPLAHVPDVMLRGFQLFEWSFVCTFVMMCMNKICSTIIHLLTQWMWKNTELLRA